MCKCLQQVITAEPKVPLPGDGAGSRGSSWHHPADTATRNRGGSGVTAQIFQPISGCGAEANVPWHRGWCPGGAQDPKSFPRGTPGAANKQSPSLFSRARFGSQLQVWKPPGKHKPGSSLGFPNHSLLKQSQRNVGIITHLNPQRDLTSSKCSRRFKPTFPSKSLLLLSKYLGNKAGKF